MADPGPTTLYRLYSSDRALLYVGISCNSGRRLVEHSTQSWWEEVTEAKFQRFDTREAAASAELEAIRREDPRYNVMGAPQRPRQRSRTLHIKDFPRDLRFAARSAAARNGESLRDFVERAVLTEVELRENEEGGR